MTLTIRCRLRVLSLLACCLLVAHASTASGQTGGAVEDAQSERDAVRARQAEVASELDVLRASDQEIAGALGAINTELSAQIDKVGDARRTTETARTVEAAAVAEVGAAEVRVSDVTARLQTMAVGLFVRPPTEDVTAAFVRAAPNETPVMFALARFRVEDTTAVLRELRQRREELAKAQRAAFQARELAEQTQRDEEARLGELETARARQQLFADQVSARIDRALGEVASLDSQDRVLATEIQRRQIALATQLAASPRVPVVVVVPAVPVLDGGPVAGTARSSPPSVSPTVTELATGSGNPGAGTTGPLPTTTTPATTASTAPPATRPPTTTTTAAPRIVTITPVATTWVRGIEVATSIAGQFEAMLAAAAASGLELSGSGYRNILDQIEIRREICGPTDYDIWVKPSWECSPPVARPGYSMHEKGLAIDFTADGDLIRSQSNPAFRWLAANAARFGFYNLPSEPWHWSTTGG